VAPAPSLDLLAHAGAPWHARNRQALIGVAAGGGGLLAAVFLLVLGRHSDPPSPAAALAASGAAPAAPAPAPETIALSVIVSPPTAQVLIDREPAPTNPFFTRLPRSTGVHHIRAVAPGFQPKERLVTFTENVLLVLTLVPAPSPPEPRRRDSGAARRLPPAAPAAAPAPQDITPRVEGDRPRRRHIETSNPYGADEPP
jgi:hypothetical protein